MTQKPTEPKIGDKMPDGTVYAGISPDTKWPMYITRPGESLTKKWNWWVTHKLNSQLKHGHDDWRSPSKSELAEVMKHQAVLGPGDITKARVRGEYKLGQRIQTAHGDIIYAGFSSQTGRHLFVPTPEYVGAPPSGTGFTCGLSEVQESLKNLREHGYKGSLPTTNDPMIFFMELPNIASEAKQLKDAPRP